MRVYKLSDWRNALAACGGIGDILNLKSALDSMAEWYSPSTVDMIHRWIHERRIALENV
jgi:hypothetical protein